MSLVKSKYRGTPKYFHVHAELVRAAQYRGLTTYQDIAVIMGLSQRGAHMGQQTGIILGEISEDELAAGRPMLSVVAVNKNLTVGPGFFGLARKTGQRKAGESKLEFVEREREAVYDAWRRPLPKN